MQNCFIRQADLNAFFLYRKSFTADIVALDGGFGANESWEIDLRDQSEPVFAWNKYLRQQLPQIFHPRSSQVEASKEPLLVMSNISLAIKGF